MSRMEGEDPDEFIFVFVCSTSSCDTNFEFTPLSENGNQKRSASKKKAKGTHVGNMETDRDETCNSRVSFFPDVILARDRDRDRLIEGVYPNDERTPTSIIDIC
jgi:hypothetical protein